MTVPAGPPTGPRTEWRTGYWDRRAAVLGLTPALSPETLEAALVAAQLTGAASPGQADEVWRRLPVLADQGRDRRDVITAWIGSLYPSVVPGRLWSGLHPDRLAERMAGRLLDADPGLAEHLAAGADEQQGGRLLTVYSRAAAHPVFRGRLVQPLVELCLRYHHRLAGPLVATATQTRHPDPLVTALGRISDDPDTALADLQALADQLPEFSRRLALWAVGLSRVLADRYRSAVRDDPPRPARPRQSPEQPRGPARRDGPSERGAGRRH
ncbi:hypothetical protein [Streptomyces odonnellii]|uniref:hypothetical protein n=1 Tax=Streptomyces odonnellii TaxID=1417980 RepID=UPI000626307C|nr:hypothetical protein [Streptomyces odonnellii]